MENKIKDKTFEIIDLLQAVKNDEASKTYDKTPEEMMAVSGEKFRLIELAQEAYGVANAMAKFAVEFKSK